MFLFYGYQKTSLVQTNDWETHYELLDVKAAQANKASLPFPKYKVHLIHSSVINIFKLIFLSSENGVRVGTDWQWFLKKITGGKEKM